MTTDEALEYLNGTENATSETSSDIANASVETTSDSIDKEDKAEEANIDTKKATDDTAEKEADSSASDKDSEKKQISKRDYAFIREREKRRRMKADYEKKIKDLEDNLKKYEGLKLEDFKGNNETYTNYLIDRHNSSNDIANMKQQIKDINQQEIDEYNDECARRAFTSEKELDEYNDLLARRGQDFYNFLGKVDPAGAIMSYLDSLPDYPILLKRLMTDRKLFDKIISRGNNPIILTQQLDSAYRAIKTPKKALPVIGKVTSNASNVNTSKGDEYWANYLKNHPRGR